VETLARHLQEHLAEIGAAEQRVADGTWGRCEVCGRVIPVERMEARPTATNCVGCAS